MDRLAKIRKNHCMCSQCQRIRIYNRNAWHKRAGHPEKCKPIPDLPREYRCDCDWCTKRRFDGRRWRAEKEERPLPSPDFRPGALYDWDRTTLEDYGPLARERLLNHRPLHPVVLRSPVRDAVASLLGLEGSRRLYLETVQSCLTSPPSSEAPPTAASLGQASSGQIELWPPTSQLQLWPE